MEVLDSCKMNGWLLFFIIFIVIGLIVAAIVLALKFTGHLSSSGSSGSGGKGSVPSAPSSLVAGTPSASSVQLTWNASTTATSYTVSYQVSGVSTWTKFNTTTDTTIDVTGLSPTTTYNFEVVAVNSSGSSSATVLNNVTTVGPSPTPTNLQATAETTTSITLTWTASTGATSYGITYQTNQSSTWTTANPVQTTSATVSGLVPGTTYNFLVTSINAYGSSVGASLTSGTLPVTPAGYSIGTIAPTSIALTWTASAGANSYDVSYQVSGATSWTDFEQVSTAGTTVTGLTAGTSYLFQITAIGTYGNSTPLVTSAAQTNGLANPPTSLQLGVMTTSTAPLSWNASAQASSYNVLYQPSGGTWTLAQNVTSTNYTVTGLTNGTTYNFEVEGVNTYGTSGPSNVVTGTTIVASGSPPSAPTGLTVGTVTSTTANLSWNAVSGATNYTVLYSTNSGSSWTIDSTDGTASTTSYTVTGLSGNTTYSFAVTANNSYGSSTHSNVATGTLPPLAPTNLTASNITTSSIDLSWSASAGASSYSLTYQTGSGAWTAWPTTGTSTTVSSLTSAAVYNFQLTATGTSGVSSPATLNNIQIGFIPGSTTYLTYSGGAVTWQNPTGTTGNILQASTNNGSTWTTIKTFTNVTSFMEYDTTIPANWWLRVYATNQWGQSSQYAVYA